MKQFYVGENGIYLREHIGTTETTTLETIVIDKETFIEAYKKWIEKEENAEE